jgi:UrcA family protein
MNVTKIVSTGLVALALTASLGASANFTKSTHNSVRVDLSDLDITTVAGEQVMQARLKEAVKQVCGSSSILTAGSPDNARKNRACSEESLANAIKDVESIQMTAAN